ncbi:contact-dependent growth inhibition system immunity protein [Streptomyces malaysiensis]|uniref:contact-dependent growth inhibition system immunity protein n=1 Tax=Streptomyces malaysiensis TaxID=92644 RepID=UPI002030F911|nr:contact-dependent growth inhibition system immunity protein [Streptomyces malaysiensis]
MPPAGDATHVVRTTVRELRCVPLGELGPEDLCTLISQQMALPYVHLLAAAWRCCRGMRMQLGGRSTMCWRS